MVSTDFVPALSPASYPQRAPSPEKQEFPQLLFSDKQVDPKALVFAGTGFRVVLGWFALVIGMIVLAASTFGVGLLGLIVAPIVDFFRWKRVRALVRGSGVHVGPDQLPEIHRCVTDFSRRLGLKNVPEVYIVESSMQNGAAMKLGTKDIILLTDDLVWSALHIGDARALGFVLGHELAHVALGHTKGIRAAMRVFLRSLARADEMSADAVATALVGDRALAVKGITLLTVGPQLIPFINEAALARQANEIWKDKHAKKAENGLTHPLLLRRIAYALGAQ